MKSETKTLKLRMSGPRDLGEKLRCAQHQVEPRPLPFHFPARLVDLDKDRAETLDEG